VDSLHMLREMTKLRSVRAFLYIYIYISFAWSPSWGLSSSMSCKELKQKVERNTVPASSFNALLVDATPARTPCAHVRRARKASPAHARLPTSSTSYNLGWEHQVRSVSTATPGHVLCTRRRARTRSISLHPQALHRSCMRFCATEIKKRRRRLVAFCGSLASVAMTADRRRIECAGRRRHTHAVAFGLRQGNLNSGAGQLGARAAAVVPGKKRNRSRTGERTTSCSIIGASSNDQ
jgi:hypothetical protein